MQGVNLNEISKQSNAMRESLRELRTNIRFCGSDIRTILFTSVNPDEGKSTVVMNLARSLVDSGNRVLVIDSDMRKSVMVGRHRARRTDGGIILGLSHFLSGQNSLDDVICTTQFEDLMIIFAGRSVVNPTELLENRYYEDLIREMRRDFDYVLIDCAPLTAAIDAAVIARECDGAVIVVSQGEASSKSVVSVKKQLEASGVRVLGVVLNKVDVKKTGYYGKYYGNYYGRYYGKYSTDEAKIDVVNETSVQQKLRDIRNASMEFARETADGKETARTEEAVEETQD